ncbi:MAG: Gfo/Idh/MocA family protein [Paracoccaceae bacterium]
MATRDLKIGVIGIDHRHIFGQLGSMESVGATGTKWWTEGEPSGTTKDFAERFPNITRVTDRRAILEDDDIDLILIAAVPDQRAALAIEAMQHGKDVMTDKPGCTTLDQLAAIKKCQAETGRIWSVDFSERFEVEAVTKADELVRDGRIGRVVQTIGMGPHRLNLPTRPDWFFDEEKYGGILCDIGSHQIDQFLHFTGSTDAEVVASTVGNYANPATPGLQDFGEVMLRSDKGHSYIRLDWYTPDALPNWGDGRLTILGTEGYIELRKYVDIKGRDGKNHVFLVNGDSYEYFDATGAGLPYFDNLANDIANRTETAMPQAHAFKATELALIAQQKATRVGNLK